MTDNNRRSQGKLYLDPDRLHHARLLAPFPDVLRENVSHSAGDGLPVPLKKIVLLQPNRFRLAMPGFVLQRVRREPGGPAAADKRCRQALRLARCLVFRTRR